MSINPFCPNLSNSDIKKEFDELVDLFGEDMAYYLWDKNKGYGLEKAPNGADSKLFNTLLDYFGDRTEALMAKKKVYTKEFFNWFGDWTKTSDKKYRYEIYDIPENRYLSREQIDDIRKRFNSGEDVVVYAASNDVQSLL
jgi:hypothetical protein